MAACDDIQLAAQAICLEAMLHKPVTEGALYYATSKRRRVVAITDQLRADVSKTAGAFRQMMTSGALPPPLAQAQATRRCKACSLQERCQPQATHASVMAGLVKNLEMAPRLTASVTVSRSV
ncbi:MAG: Dna2/Cas4 domain-containing protein [Rhodoferax sp.]|nr:Dna2/Cas4 domain-containing protein [Rhodoferax sp.]